MDRLKNFFISARRLGSHSTPQQSTHVTLGNKGSSEVSAKNTGGGQIQENVTLYQRDVTWEKSPFKLMYALKSPVDYLWGKGWTRPRGYERVPPKIYRQLRSLLSKEQITEGNMYDWDKKRLRYDPFYLLKRCCALRESKGESEDLKEVIDYLQKAGLRRLDVHKPWLIPTLIRESVDFLDDTPEIIYTLHRALESGGLNEMLKPLVDYYYDNIRGADREKENINQYTISFFRSLVYHQRTRSVPETLKAMIDAGMNPNTRRSGEPPVIYLLEEAISNMEEKTNERGTKNCIAIVKCLIEHEAVDLNVVNRKGSGLLHIAFDYYSTKIAMKLIKSGRLNLALKDRDGNTALNDFVIRASMPSITQRRKPSQQQFYRPTARELAEAMIAANPEVINISNNNGDTPLHIAAKRGVTTLVKTMIAANPEAMNTRNNNGDTPLHIALSQGNTEAAKAIIAANPEAMNIPNNNGDTPLHIAAKLGDTELVQILIALNREAIDTPNNKGDTPLHLAAKQGNTESVQILINAGSKAINTPNNKGNTPLHLAAKQGMMDTARLFMQQAELHPTTDPQDTDQKILFLALREGRADFVKELITHDTVDPNQLNQYGETPLHAAISDGNPELIKALLNVEDEAEELTLPGSILINQKNRYGDTLLMYAVELGSVRLVDMLLKHPNVDIDIRANREEGGNNTAFMKALKEGNEEVVRAFVEASKKYDHIHLDINAELEDGKTALMLAAERGYGGCIRELLKHPEIDVHKKDPSGKTPLMLALKEGNMYNALDAFFEHKSIDEMLNETDRNGNTAFMIARQEGYEDSIKYFSDKGKGINKSE